MIITGKFLENLAYFYTNTNRWDLENVGIIQAGKSGDQAWERFNHNFDIFILKLSDEQQDSLAKLFEKYIPDEIAPAAFPLLAFKDEVDRIASDYVPDHDRDAPAALQEMRDALFAAVAAA